MKRALVVFVLALVAPMIAAMQSLAGSPSATEASQEPQGITIIPGGAAPQAINTLPGDPVVARGKLGAGTSSPRSQLEVVSSQPNEFAVRILGYDPIGYTSGGLQIVAEGNYLTGPTQPILSGNAGDGPKIWVQKDGSTGLGYKAHQTDPLTILTLNQALDGRGAQHLIHGRDTAGNLVFYVDEGGDAYSRGQRLGLGAPGPKGSPGPQGPPGSQGPQGPAGQAVKTVASCASNVPQAQVRHSCSKAPVAYKSVPGGSCSVTAETGSCTAAGAASTFGTTYAVCSVCAP